MRDILFEFGFCSLRSFMCSTFEINKVTFLSIFAFMATLINILANAVGLSPVTLLILFLLLVFELIFGTLAGIKRLGKFKIKRFQRFALKVLIYFLLILVFNTLINQYEPGNVEYYVYGSIHSFIVFYIIGVYIISILTNVSYLMGGSQEIDNLTKIFKLKVKNKIDDVSKH